MGKAGWTITIIGGLLLLAVPTVGIALAILWVVICWGFSALVRHGSAAEAPGEVLSLAPKRPLTPTASTKARADGYRAPRPRGNPTPPWSPRLSRHEVAGEFFYPKAFEQLRRRFLGSADLQSGGHELVLDAHLVPEPDNPHDSNAVAVYVDGLQVGHLERETAAEYHRPIAERTAAGELVTVPSRQWIYWGYRDNRPSLRARVTIHLPPPNGFSPVVGMPGDEHVVLPSGSTIQVTKEEEHMAVLAPHLASGADLPIAVTLHAITEIRPRSAVDAIEVRLLGERVGILTPTQTANIKPLVDYVEARGKVAMSRATLVGNQIKADVTLHVAKAQDVDQQWLDGLGEPVAQRTTEIGTSSAQPGRRDT